ncbi:MAG: ABC-three component system protein [Gluconobacter japonicus]|uniref:ABC-three component system protein n=1 Tax=Gluconobacter japonicus TaxID=376620 RepID=UPI0039ECAC5E
MTSPSYSEFSAGDSMLGYIYQCEYALYHLLDRDNPAKQISIETTDDVVSDGLEGDPQTLLQLKLHRHNEENKAASLTDRNPDIWKTIRVWATHIHSSRLDPSITDFVLMTTAPEPSDERSFAYLLSPKGASSKRNPLIALPRLTKLAREISDDANLSDTGILKKGAEAYLLLKEDQRINLVKNMTVVTSSPSIIGLRKKIDQRLKASGGTDEVHGQFVEGVVGWWYGACISHLHGKGKHPITFEALSRKIAELAQSLTLSSLPAYDLDEALDNKAMDTLRTRTFVRQIVEVGYRSGGDFLMSAMLDFYKADAHRKRWIEELRVDDIDIRNFEGELRSRWRIYFGSVELECDDCAISSDPESGYRKLGQRILKDTLSTQSPSLKGFDASFLARGSYHILANGKRPVIGWHPLWRDRFYKRESDT